jgi:hypothetical protein
LLGDGIKHLAAFARANATLVYSPSSNAPLVED